jgi:membrane protein implicated in regulation of membrane protease activity
MAAIVLALISAFVVFLALAGVGFLFLLVSLAVGELFDLADIFDHDLDHGHGGPSFFSSRVLSVFVTAFGGFGAIGMHLGYGVGVSTAIGLASGFVFGGIIYAFVRALHGQEASTDVHSGDLVGATAQVTVAIPQGGLGQVRCIVGESAVEKIARAQDGSAIPASTVVRVEAVLGETVLVRRAE